MVSDIPAEPTSPSPSPIDGALRSCTGEPAALGARIGSDEFDLDKYTATLTFIAAFGIVKAATNFFAAPSPIATAANPS